MTALLAKSRFPGRPALSLEAHCRDTEQAAAGVFREDGRWAAAWARFFQLDQPSRSRFLLNLRIAGLFHDIGKANQDFQALMGGEGRTHGPQTLRHEHISALLLSLPELRGWLSHNPALDVDVITTAVLSHHLKASDQGDYAWGMPNTTRPVPLRLDHPEITAIFERVRLLADLEETPPLPANAWSHDKAPWAAARKAGITRARDLRRSLRADPTRRRLLLAVKAGVIVADTVASGVFRSGGTLDRWIEDVVHMPALSAEDIANKIIAPRIRQVEGWTGATFHFHRFQTLASEQGRRALLVAGCGSGKTLAAWKWAERRAREEPIGRVLFLYPTRGTATEGFRDYVGWAPEGEAALLHGTAAYELEAMQQNPPESMKGKAPVPDEHAARLYALEHWPRRFFSATVDQFLGFMEHYYTGICLLPALADSAIIFDEVHSYDGPMFQTLLAFLDHFDVPVLCMTATLPPDHRDELEKRGMSIFPDDSHRDELADLERQECRPRYHVAPVDGAAAALERVQAAHASGQRVLWVVNTVRECQRVADMLAHALAFEPLVYHSRFRLCDRKRAHEQTIEAFRPGKGPAIAVTTQVCEMSLDLDADMLVTEIAPVTSLVQRFGRSNRATSRPETDRSVVLWYPPERHLPYTREELRAGRALLEGLGAAEVSQRRLAEALAEHAPVGPVAQPSASFLTGGYYAVPGSLREDTDYTVTAVLDTDLDALLALKRARRAYDGLLVPVPKRHILDVEPRPGELPRHIEIAPSRHYSQTRGFIAPEGA